MLDSFVYIVATLAPQSGLAQMETAAGPAPASAAKFRCGARGDKRSGARQTSMGTDPTLPLPSCAIPP